MSKATAKVTPQRRSHAERTELSDARMFAAAIDLIDAEGAENTKLKEVGEKAGYSRGLAGSRFKSKEGLFCFVVKRVSEYWLAEMRSATQALSGYAAIEATIDAHYRFCQVSPKEVRVLYLLWFEALDKGTNHEKGELHERVCSIHRRRLADVMVWIEEQAKASGRSSVIDADAVARLFLNAVTGIIYQWLIAPSKDDEIHAQHETLKDTMRLLLAVDVPSSTR